MRSGGDLGVPGCGIKTCMSCSGKCKMIMKKVRVTNEHLSLVDGLPGHSDGHKASGASLCIFPEQVVILRKSAVL